MAPTGTNTNGSMANSPPNTSANISHRLDPKSPNILSSQSTLMCGRFTLTGSPAEVEETFGLHKVPANFPQRYNIAPSQPVAAILQNRQGDREFTHLQWGLIPAWAKDPGIGTKLINARAETVHEKPSFKAAFKYRRCLIPTSGFYEWQKLSKGKQPYCFSMLSQPLFAMAGLWEDWNGILTCTILTTEANSFLEGIHDRMPVILKPQDSDNVMAESQRWRRWRVSRVTGGR
jgi:putative SOS response-associated peptidase YedK